ncbi:CPBP family intramembrane metalloprotease [Clostridium sporogenes]|uniref:CPBP family intramembrane glutamic endopeptidase n=1 Tax=Clostridium sporogenes TaxID=1509 RepID=UPI002237F109|nr:CPBP family intramembrane glutamic endopeptidase [Clostridium sporogenes]MCW6059837.1 CPBP family intramembrane metalloprotease [Clostridium sporogenes]MCW6067210.1 CPBP family intramembrane metalloprotease [Clostridium sporogenes]
MESKLSNKGFQLSVIGALLIIICDFILELLVGIPFEILSEIIHVNSYNKSLELIVGILKEVVPNILVIIIILKGIREDYKPNFKIKYAEKFNFKLLLCTIFLMLGFFFWFHSSIGMMIRKIPVSESWEKVFEDILKNPYPMFISFIIIAPIFEEILMRGIILEGFLNKYKPVTAIIISSIMFGAMHLNIFQFVNATIGGLFLGVIYYKTRSLVLSIVAHMVNNAIPILGIQRNIISFFIGAIIFIIAAIFFQKYIKELKYIDINSQENSVSSKI